MFRHGMRRASYVFGLFGHLKQELETAKEEMESEVETVSTRIAALEVHRAVLSDMAKKVSRAASDMGNLFGV